MHCALAGKAGHPWYAGPSSLPLYLRGAEMLPCRLERRAELRVPPRRCGCEQQALRDAQDASACGAGANKVSPGLGLGGRKKQRAWAGSSRKTGKACLGYRDSSKDRPSVAWQRAHPAPSRGWRGRRASPPPRNPPLCRPTPRRAPCTSPAAPCWPSCSYADYRAGLGFRSACLRLARASESNPLITSSSALTSLEDLKPFLHDKLQLTL